MRLTIVTMMLAGLLAGILALSTATAQTTVYYPPATAVYGQPVVAGYGAGYVGMPSNPPATTVYRAPLSPGYGGVVPVTSYYAPAVNYGYGANLRMQSRPALFAATSPAISMNSYYAPAANYPPQTVFPTAVAPVAVNTVQPAVAYRPTVVYSPAVAQATYQVPAQVQYAPAPTIANYATPNFYRTNYARTPVTYYRPVVVMDPATGGANTVLQPQTGYEWQARRQSSWFSWMHPWRNSTPQAPMQTLGYAPAGATCSGPGCGTCGTPATAQPYYVPSAAPSTVSPYATPSVTYPATVPGATTISPPATFVPSTVTPSNVVPGTTISPSISPSTTFPGSVPANTVPSLGPGGFDSGPTRRDFPPSVDSYIVPPSAASPMTPAPRESVAPTDYPSNSGEAADQIPSLSAPTNSSSEYRRPQATIRRELNVTPIPDPEYGGAGTQQKAAPRLLRTDDRTAQRAQQETLRRVAYERDLPAIKPSHPPAGAARPVAAPYRILGDDAWQPLGK